MNTFFDDVQFFFLSLFSATTEGSGKDVFLEGHPKIHQIIPHEPNTNLSILRFSHPLSQPPRSALRRTEAPRSSVLPPGRPRGRRDGRTGCPRTRGSPRGSKPTPWCGRVVWRAKARWGGEKEKKAAKRPRLRVNQSRDQGIVGGSGPSRAEVAPASHRALEFDPINPQWCGFIIVDRSFTSSRQILKVKSLLEVLGQVTRMTPHYSPLSKPETALPTASADCQLPWDVEVPDSYDFRCGIPDGEAMSWKQTHSLPGPFRCSWHH